MKAAIYTRKSRFTGKGDSIENQVQFCIDYAHKLGIYNYEIYEDEGYSGSNTNRPKFKQLLKDAKNKKFEYLICYRLDRISRNVSDFSTLIEILNKLDISFISIKEQFDTSTPMGRAMMYIASVFSQLERETIAERVKDNMYELARSGRWLGGSTPLGYKSEKVLKLDSNLKERSYYKLIPVESEISIVKLIYDKYLEFRSLSQLYKFMYKQGINGPRGNPFDMSSLGIILRNPVYVKSTCDVIKYLSTLKMDVIGVPDNKSGILTYGKNTISPIATVSSHSGIIESSTWLEVQKILNSNKDKSPRSNTGKTSLLSGLLKCSKCNSNMRVVSKKTANSSVNYYYICGGKKKLGPHYCNCKNLNGKLVENIIIEYIKSANIDYIIKSYIDNKTLLINSKSRIKSDMINIENKIKEKEKIISNLVLELPKNSGSQFYSHIVNKITMLDNDIKSLKNELDNFHNDSTNIDEFNINIDLLINNINKFNDEINTDCIDKKRILIRNIISKIIWDSELGQLSIQYLGLSTVEQINISEKLHFIAQSRSYINER